MLYSVRKYMCRVMGTVNSSEMNLWLTPVLMQVFSHLQVTHLSHMTCCSCLYKRAI